MPPAPRPNIVFILLDDVRYDDMVDHKLVTFPKLLHHSAAVRHDLSARLDRLLSNPRLSP